MNNPERLATLGTQDEGKKQKQKQKTKNTQPNMRWTPLFT